MVVYNPKKNAFKEPLRIEPMINGGFVVITNPKMDGFNYPTHAFTNAADLLEWINSELAPQTPTIPVPTTREGQITMMNDDWIEYTPGPLPGHPSFVDVKYMDGSRHYHQPAKENNWSKVTHWRPSK
jgi:hypothetical protein